MSNVLIDTANISTANSAGASVTSLTWTHVVASNSNMCLFVSVTYVAPTAGEVTGITYNGVAMTKVDSSIANLGVGTGRAVDLWYLKAPASGSHSVVVSAGTSTGPLTGAAITLYNVNQTTPLGTSVKANSTSAATLSVTTTTSTSSDVVVGVSAARSTSTTTVGGSQTKQYSVLQGTNILAWGSTQAGGASVSSSFTQGGAADNIAILAVPVLNDGVASNNGAGFFMVV